MTDRQRVISNEIEKVRELILESERWLWKHPQTGFREWKAHQYMAEKFEDLGYELKKAGNIPGFYADVDTGRPGPKVLILSELDSLICADHPDADPETGAVHSCGHHAQCAAMLGIAYVLKEPDFLNGLSGTVRLCVVPAEELIEIDYRKRLRKDGVIHYLGGKTEFLYRGYFDSVDLAFMVHTTQGKSFMTRVGYAGCITKRIVYKGTSAHAGGAPWQGCNALYAATLGLQAINSIRETFQEKDLVRVHPILTHGGTAVNAIPDRAIIESYIRGTSFDALYQTNEKVNRALCGTALSLGANVDIQDSPGYAPLFHPEHMVQIAKEAATIEPSISYEHFQGFTSGSTDMGDLSCLFPVVHPCVPGASGIGHGSNYQISDPELACVVSAKWQLAILDLLLSKEAARAKSIVESFEPRFATKEEYFDYIDKLFVEGDRIAYKENGEVFVKT